MNQRSPRVSLRDLLIGVSISALVFSFMPRLNELYHRFQIHAIESGYYRLPLIQILAMRDYHSSKLAEMGAISSITRQFPTPKSPDLLQITRTPNLPPYYNLTVDGGQTTTVIVYADSEYEDQWRRVLDSLEQ